MKNRLLLCIIFSIMLLGKGISQGSGFSFGTFVGMDLFLSDPLADFEQLSTDDIITDFKSPYLIGLEASYFLKRSSIKYYATYRVAHRSLRTSINNENSKNPLAYNQHSISLGLTYGRRFKNDLNKGIEIAFDLGVAGHSNNDALFANAEIVDGVQRFLIIDIATNPVIPVFSLSCQYVQSLSTDHHFFVGIGVFGQPFRGYSISSSLYTSISSIPSEDFRSSGALFRIWSPTIRVGVDF